MCSVRVFSSSVIYLFHALVMRVLSHCMYFVRPLLVRCVFSYLRLGVFRVVFRLCIRLLIS